MVVLVEHPAMQTPTHIMKISSFIPDRSVGRRPIWSQTGIGALHFRGFIFAVGFESRSKRTPFSNYQEESGTNIQKFRTATLPSSPCTRPTLTANVILLAHNLSQAAYRRILLDVVVVDPVDVGASILIYQSAATRVGSEPYTHMT